MDINLPIVYKFHYLDTRARCIYASDVEDELVKLGIDRSKITTSMPKLIDYTVNGWFAKKSDFRELCNVRLYTLQENNAKYSIIRYYQFKLYYKECQVKPNITIDCENCILSSGVIYYCENPNIGFPITINGDELFENILENLGQIFIDYVNSCYLLKNYYTFMSATFYDGVKYEKALVHNHSVVKSY
jgi:hypothetical protein